MRLHAKTLVERKITRAETHLRPAPEFLKTKTFVRHRWRLRTHYFNKAVKFLGRVLIFVFEAMFDGGRMVRRVGPGMRPEERYEFDRNYRDQHGRGF